MEEESIKDDPSHRNIQHVLDRWKKLIDKSSKVRSRRMWVVDHLWQTKVPQCMK